MMFAMIGAIEMDQCLACFEILHDEIGHGCIFDRLSLGQIFTPMTHGRSKNICITFKSFIVKDRKGSDPSFGICINAVKLFQSTGVNHIGIRSEEHTSELQSRQYLV